MSQAGKYPDCEICEYKIFMEDAQKEVESEPSTCNQQLKDSISLAVKSVLPEELDVHPDALPHIAESIAKVSIAKLESI